MPDAPTSLPNRTLLAGAGLGLSDADYSEVIAGLGVIDFTWTARDGSSRKALGWSADKFLDERASHGFSAAAAVWLTYRDAWRAALKQVNPARVVVVPGTDVNRGPDLLEVIQVLSQPAAGAASLFIDRLSPAWDLRWQWPMRIAATEQDFASLDLGRLGGLWPARELAAPRMLTQGACDAEVLILTGGLRRALTHILTFTHRVRARYLIVLGPLDSRWSRVRPAAEALMSETQARGIALYTAHESDLVAQLNHWVEELSHNTAFDIAYTKAFPLTQSLITLDRRLIEAAALPAAARSLAHRLQQMPPEVLHNVPAQILISVGLGSASNRPAPTLGAVLGAGGAALPYGHESLGASAISAIASATRAAERELARTEQPRYLQGSVFSYDSGLPVQETRALVTGFCYTLEVLVGEAGTAPLVADQRFPDEELEWPDEEPLTLQALLVVSMSAEPLRGTLQLPRRGASSICRFTFTPTDPGAFTGRLILSYRGRILQTALLEATVVLTANELANLPPTVQSIRLRVEARLRRSLQTLDERRDFDAFLVCNHTSSYQAALTAAGTGGAYVASLDKIKQPIARIGEILTQVAHDTRTYSKGLLTKANAALLRDLAVEGNALYRCIVLDYVRYSSSALQIEKAQYLQIVTMQPESLVPLEFIYDYPLPDGPAPVCPNAPKVLESKSGQCPASCRPNASPAPHVCPLGFWGLKKVIERHMHVPALEKPAKIVSGPMSEPIAGRAELALPGGTLIAMSREIPVANGKALDKSVRQIRGSTVASVTDWPGWRDAIEHTMPTLLLALPHAGGQGADVTLEIGGNTLHSNLIDGSYVHVASRPAPIVMLLGCDTASQTNTTAYLSHVDVFRQADAALVLGTIATVLGADAVLIAEKLLTHLTEVTRKESQRFGEVLVQVKRAAVADSLMVALGLVAFGDADWVLTPHAN